jgi:predicted metal-dependent hydrolase
MQWPEADMVLEGTQVRYAVRESRRARRMGVWVGPGAGLVATVPLGTPPSRIEPFLAQHARWILRQLARMRALGAPRWWPYGDRLLYRGIEHAVSIRKHPEPGVERAEGGADGTDGPALVVNLRSPTVEAARRRLKDWLKVEARLWLTIRAEQLSRQMGVSWTRLSVRDQRRRWGSCSRAGRLSFNYRLIMAPPAVLDYVVIHELAHLRHQNHSRRFWDVVRAYDPACAESIAWLKARGPSLGL